MNTKDIVYVALFAALTAALGLFPPLTLPAVGVPITAQSMGVMLAGALAGSKRGGYALLLFVILVAIGLPLLAGGRGGFGIFLGPSGGFILSWPIAAFLIGWLFERHQGETPFALSLLYIALGGVGVVYLIGVPWVAFSAELTFVQAFTGSAGFIPGDIVKVVVAALIARGVRRAYPGL
ncbi:biotin transporter BioY [Loktanella agnita]|uniref:biotin transporter BioY n=1 Tax=Loktanella agnita TaxID=287097 RepID=UPI00398A10F5